MCGRACGELLISLGRSGRLGPRGAKRTDEEREGLLGQLQVRKLPWGSKGVSWTKVRERAPEEEKRGGMTLQTFRQALALPVSELEVAGSREQRECCDLTGDFTRSVWTVHCVEVREEEKTEFLLSGDR